MRRDVLAWLPWAAAFLLLASSSKKGHKPPPKPPTGAGSAWDNDLISYKVDERGLIHVTTEPGNVQWGTPTLVGAELAKFWAMVGQWRALVDEASLDYGVPSALVFAIMYGESGGNPAAVSKAGALGLMQVMPFHFTTAERPRALEPRTNLRKGATILKVARAGGSRDLVEVASMYDAGGPKTGGPWTNGAWLAARRNPTHTTRWGYAGEPGYLDKVVAANNAFILGGEA